MDSGSSLQVATLAALAATRELTASLLGLDSTPLRLEILVAYPPSGGTSPTPSHKVLTAETALREWCSPHWDRWERTGLPAVTLMDANAIASAALDARDVHALPRDDSVLCTALARGPPPAPRLYPLPDRCAP